MLFTLLRNENIVMMPMIVTIIFAVTIVTAWIAYFIISQETKRRDREFFGFLEQNRADILSGGEVIYNDKAYNIQTKIKRYRMCISFVVMTEARGSYFVHEDDFLKMSVITFLITLFGGWWGLPWGPIRTIETFIKNTDNNIYTIGDILYGAGIQ